MSSMASSPLLSLPAELRLQIYNSVGPETQISYFTGLLLTCRTVHDEVVHELFKAIKERVETVADDIRSKGGEILYTAPTTLHGWLNLTVSRPVRTRMLSRNDPYLQFVDLFLENLTITFHDPPDGYEFRPDRRDPFRLAMFQLSKYIWRSLSADWVPALRRLSLDWSAYPQAYDPLQARDRWFKCGPDIWKLEIPRNAGNLVTGASFHKLPGKTTNTAKEARYHAPRALEISYESKSMILGDLDQKFNSLRGEAPEDSNKVKKYISRKFFLRWIEKVRQKSADIRKLRS